MIQVPGYLIKREIGKGGMATVYLAVQASLDRDVALKVMQPALANDPNFSRRFLQEARTLASLSHPNIVAVYDVGVTEAQLHYFAMQHLPGGDFAHRIRAGVDQTEVVRVLAGVARALGFAHQRGFVHRDVSPANILFDASEHPILTDFGIARAVARTSRLTNAGVSVGTSHYMSPEQARGADVDARSDIYSLGCVTYEALTGKAPYSGEDGFAIAYAHVFEPIPRLAPELAHWQPLIDRALAKNAADRFATLDEFLEALAGVGAAPLPAEPAPEPELFDDSDFLASDPARTQQIPAALLDAIPTPAPAPAPAAAVPEARAARESVSSRPPRAMPLRGIGIAAAVVVLAALVAWLVMRGPDPGDRAAAAVTAATPAVAAPAPAVDT
ncbi:MAG TPA: serine/threonine-protein kinase, partial [Xanthomonadales bacterium]|nr:serine/threonine-protein kinase [Xanthomonadales bacterium]